MGSVSSGDVWHDKLAPFGCNVACGNALPVASICQQTPPDVDELHQKSHARSIFCNSKVFDLPASPHPNHHSFIGK